MDKTDSKEQKLNKNAGFTLVEMIATFALLGLFMVAASRVISYTTSVYYQAKGATYGMQVASVVSNKMVGLIEGAKAGKPKVKTTGTGKDEISLIDETGSSISITADDYIRIHYDEVTEGSIKYDAVDWRFDPKAYMGYKVKELKFENPGSEYPENVLKMTLVLTSPKYGDFQSVYFIKCVNAEGIIYE